MPTVEPYGQQKEDKLSEVCIVVIYFESESGIGNQGHVVSTESAAAEGGWRRTGEVHVAQDEIPKNVGCLPEDAERDHDASGGEEEEVKGAPEGHQQHGHHYCRVLP